MNLIDRYVQSVGLYLPKDIRDDVLIELRTNIEDMLPENYTEEDAYKVLEEMGSPLKLANEYNPNKRYLIGPGYFDKYLEILKLVVGISIAASIGITVLVWIMNSYESGFPGSVVELFTKIITGALVGAEQGVFWVTLSFVILERINVDAGNLLFYNKEWTPDSLPELPMNDNMKISRGETIFSIICTIILTALLYLQPQLIAIYRLGEKGVMKSTPFFDINRLKIYMIFIFAMAVLQLALFVWKYISEKWNMPLIICNAIYNVLMCILMVVMLKDSALINSHFLSEISDITKGSIEAISIWINKGKWIFAAFFIGFCAWDSIGVFYKFRTKVNTRFDRKI